MKNYFDFLLSGKKLLPYWIGFFLVFGISYAYLVMKIFSMALDPKPPLIIFPIIIIILIAAVIFAYFRLKFTIENISFKEQILTFKGTIGGFVGVYLLGIFLSIITLGIYLAWFIKDLQKYVVNNTYYGNDNFRFNGKGGKLFVIFLLTLFVPIIIITILFTAVFTASLAKQGNPQAAIGMVGVIYVLYFFILIPYIYYVYKWMIDVKFQNYHITLSTKALPSIAKIALEILLTIVTLGIYSPVAYLKIYKLFTDNTIANGGKNGQRAGFDIEPGKDFLVFWGQTLLTLITFGIYYPWAYCRIMKLIANKTYIEPIDQI